MKNPKRSNESIALEAAMKAAGLSQAAISRHMDVTPAAVRQWVMGQRPVPPPKAQRLAALLSVDPGSICPGYAAVVGHAGNVVPMRSVDGGDQRRTGLAISRVENDVDSMRYALGALTAVMVAHRPTEAKDVAAAIRKQVPRKFVERGFLHELLAVLDRAAKA